jgi:hypothetical protein
VYKVSSATGGIQSKATLAGDCAHMHADYPTGNLYTFCSSPGGKASVWEIAGASPKLVADVTAAVAGGATLPGQTTHCSAFRTMYIGVAHGGAGKDAIISLNLTSGKVYHAATLAEPLPRALWAVCNTAGPADGYIGGVSWAPGASPAANGTATFGEFDAASGTFKQLFKVGVPDELEPSGLLTETEDQLAIAAFYPKGYVHNATVETGALWTLDPFGKSGEDAVAQYSYNLLSASWDTSAR